MVYMCNIPPLLRQNQIRGAQSKGIAFGKADPFCIIFIQMSQLNAKYGGLYFIEPLLRAWRARGDINAINWDKVESLEPYGGVRIEDNMLVTGGEPRNLTREGFASL